MILSARFSGLIMVLSTVDEPEFRCPLVAQEDRRAAVYPQT
jgi:hypothetical protein